jgi:hypothetical protein
MRGSENEKLSCVASRNGHRSPFLLLRYLKMHQASIAARGIIAMPSAPAKSPYINLATMPGPSQ